MRRSLKVVLACTLILSAVSLHSTEDSRLTLAADQNRATVGGDALSQAVTTSMLIWGFALIASISILSIVIHQSAGSSS